MTFLINSGIALQVNEGAPVPTPAQFSQFKPATFRDVLGWHKSELTKSAYTIPSNDNSMYQLGIPVIITLYGGNPIYGLKPSQIPTTPAQIAAFATWAAWVAKTLNPYAISIWNEMNGSFNGGIVQIGPRQIALADLTNATAAAIRAANPNVKIIAGASVGWNMDGWFINLAQKAKLDFSKVDYLDSHPYISTTEGVINWHDKLVNIRNAGINLPFYYTEWGGSCYTPGYMPWFIKNVVAADAVPVAGGNYFTLLDSAKFTAQGLITSSGMLTEAGQEFVSTFAA